MSDAQQGLAPDCLQRVLRSRFRQQVKPSVVQISAAAVCVADEEMTMVYDWGTPTCGQ